MPGDLHKLWRARDPKQYHVEYGYSCMGYEIAGALGVKLAAPDREVFALVGDGSYLMMAQEIVTAVPEGIKLNRRARAEPRLRLDRRAVGVARLAALRHQLPLPRRGDRRCSTARTLPVDLAANAESLGADVHPRRDDRGPPRRRSPQARGVGPAPPSSTSRPTRSPRCRRSESWWDVPVAEVAALDSTNRPARPTTAHKARASERRSTRPGGTQRREDHQALDRRQARRPGTSDPHEPGLEPGHRRAAGRGAAGQRRRRRRRRAAAAAAFETWSQSSLSQRTKVLFAFRELVNARIQRASPSSSPTSTARCSPTRAARCSAAWRSSSSPAASRRCSRASYSDQVSTGVDVFSFRQPLGRRRRHHAVQLPGHGADVDAPGGHRLRQHVRAQAQRARPVAPRMLRRRAVGRGRAARRRVQRRARRQGGRRRAARPPATSRRSRSSAPRRSPATSTSAAPRTASACRPSAAPRTTRSSCPTPTSTSPPTTSSPPRSARPASAAWRSPRRSPSAARPTSWSTRSARRPAPTKVGPGRDADSEMGPVITAAARDRIVGLIGTGAEQGADARRRRPRPHGRRATRTASSSARP